MKKNLGPRTVQILPPNNHFSITLVSEATGFYTAIAHTRNMDPAGQRRTISADVLIQWLIDTKRENKKDRVLQGKILHVQGLSKEEVDFLGFDPERLQRICG